MSSLARSSFALIAIVFAVSLAHGAESIFTREVNTAKGKRRLVDAIEESGVNKKALKTALSYFDKYESRFPNNHYITLIDYSKSSIQQRFYLIDLKTGQVTKELVAHGRGSGGKNATHFGNRGRTGVSSLGFFRTAETYTGKHGYSLRLDGLSSTNSNARARSVVIHPAGILNLRIRGKVRRVPYVSNQIINIQGMLGRSLGCPALDPAVSKPVIDRIRHGSMIYAFD